MGVRGLCRGGICDGVLLSRGARCPRRCGAWPGGSRGGAEAGHAEGARMLTRGGEFRSRAGPSRGAAAGRGCLTPGRTGPGSRGAQTGRAGCPAGQGGRGNSLFHGACARHPHTGHRRPPAVPPLGPWGCGWPSPRGTGSGGRETAGSGVCLGLRGSLKWRPAMHAGPTRVPVLGQGSAEAGASQRPPGASGAGKPTPPHRCRAQGPRPRVRAIGQVWAAGQHEAGAGSGEGQGLGSGALWGGVWGEGREMGSLGCAQLRAMPLPYARPPSASPRMCQAATQAQTPL